MTREDRRQFTHLGATSLALALIWLPEWAGYAICGAVILLEWVVLPLCGAGMGLERADEPYLNGLKTYPLAVLLVLVCFPLAAAVAAWGVMGVGDAASNLIGRRFGTPGFLGRRDRSLAGSLAFVLTAWPAAWALAAHVGGHAAAWIPALAAAAAGAAAELVPMPRWLDDNLPIALAAATAFHLAA